MPIKHKFIVKTVVNASEKLDATTDMLATLADLRKGALDTKEGLYIRIEILVKKKDGVIIVDSLDTEGELTATQKEAAAKLQKDTYTLVKGHGEDGKVKLVFLVDTRKN